MPWLYSRLHLVGGGGVRPLRRASNCPRSTERQTEVSCEKIIESTIVGAAALHCTAPNARAQDTRETAAFGHIKYHGPYMWSRAFGSNGIECARTATRFFFRSATPRYQPRTFRWWSDISRSSQRYAKSAAMVQNKLPTPAPRPGNMSESRLPHRVICERYLPNTHEHHRQQKSPCRYGGPTRPAYNNTGDRFRRTTILHVIAMVRYQNGAGTTKNPCPPQKKAPW